MDSSTIFILYFQLYLYYLELCIKFVNESEKDHNMEVVGREDIKELFAKIMKSENAEFIAVYGRRRVGKTYLVRQYFKQNIVFDFTGAYEADTSIQLFNFMRELIRLNPQLEYVQTPTNWSEAFQILTDYIYALPKDGEKIVVFLDELPWLDQARSGFISALEYFWNQHGSKMHNLVLITCGSAASWIMQNLIQAKGGLYRRVTHAIELLPFTLCETEKYLDYLGLKFTRYQTIQLYSIIGGIPFYLNMIPKGKSVPQVINELFFEIRSPLSQEFIPLYRSLFTNADHAMAIVEALSIHPYGSNQENILKAVNIPAGGSFNRALNSLIECGFVKPMIPFGKKKKDTSYRLVDFYSHFYLRFVKGITDGRPNAWENFSSSAAFKAWSGYAFENVCIMHMKQIHQALGISGVFTTISSWKYPGTNEIRGSQIDLVISRKDGIIHLCEAKFSNAEYAMTNDYNTLLRQRRATFKAVTGTKNLVVNTLLTTYPAIKNKYYLEEIHSEIDMEALFMP